MQTAFLNNCDCGFTGGCKKCNPFSFIGSMTDEEANEARGKLKDWKKRFDDDFNKRHLKLFKNAS